MKRLLRRLLVCLALGLATGCEGALRDPTGLSQRDPNPGGGGGGGGSGSSLLIGSWQVVFIFQLNSDIQRHTTTWDFRTDGSCRRTVEVFSVLEDRTLTTFRDCTFRTGSGDVTITYAGNPATVTFRWSLDRFSRNRLLLDGVTYDRIG